VFSIYKRLTNTAFATEFHPAKAYFISEQCSYSPPEILGAVLGYMGETLKGKNDHDVHKVLLQFTEGFRERAVAMKPRELGLIKSCISETWIASPLADNGIIYLFASLGATTAPLIRTAKEDDWVGFPLVDAPEGLV